MRSVLSFILLAACLAAPVHARDTHEADVAAIRQVVEQFKGAIIARDAKTLGGLFLQDHDSWLSVVDQQAWTAIKARDAAARKVQPWSWKKFAEFVQNSPKPVEERFYGVRIDTNGTVATVWFEFDFLIDGEVTNRGSECWQMVHAEDGWKISSMLFSSGP